MNGEAGKGDTYRPVNHKTWAENYERIFGKKNKVDEDQSEDRTEALPSTTEDESTS